MNNHNRPFLISCGISRKEIEKLVEEKSIFVEPYFLDAGLHVDYDELEKRLTSAIEECSKPESKVMVRAHNGDCLR